MIIDANGTPAGEAEFVAPAATSDDTAAAATSAQRRRFALAVLLRELRLTPADLARMVGCQPNAFYNFLNGRSAALSLDTIERILMAFPNVTFEDLVGWSPRTSAPVVPPTRPTTPLTDMSIMVEVSAGSWCKRFTLTPEA